MLLRIRIIPAHAGFTTETLENQPKTTDHPRTRGVYVVVYPPVAFRGGSSPHTRGLPDGLGLFSVIDVDHPRTRGVYPPGGVRGVPKWDHPRTRGVYPGVSFWGV